ncbi:MAG: transposase [Treponema sp.]|nr:transposase [Treponema sp.]
MKEETKKYPEEFKKQIVELYEKIREIYYKSKRRYGAPKIYKTLKKNGVQI